MPSSFAHYRFGEQLIPMLPTDIRNCVQRNRHLFDLGLQGPDFFFYYKLGKKTPVMHLAREYHHRTGKAAFSKICSCLGQPTDEETAYLNGLLAHYCLDARCHPIVSRVTGSDAMAHNAMESEFERFLMERSGIARPHTHNRGATIRCSGKHAAVIARFYPETQAAQIQQAMNTMGVVLGLLTVHAGAKKVLAWMGPPNPGLLMHKVPDQTYAGCNQELLDGYHSALNDCPELVRQLQNHIATGVELGEAFDPIFG